MSCSIGMEAKFATIEQIKYFIKSIKGSIRISYIEYYGYGNMDGSIISLTDDLSTMTDEELWTTISNESRCNEQVEEREDGGSIMDAIELAKAEFIYGDSANLQRDMKVVLVTYCDEDDVDLVCEAFENDMFMDMYMIHNGERFDDDDDTYLVCLVEYDESRLWSNMEFNDNNIMTSFYLN